MNFKAAIIVTGCVVFIGTIEAGVPQSKADAKTNVAAAKPAIPQPEAAADNPSENTEPAVESTEPGTSPSAAFASAARNDANPYAVITERNIFHLNPPPPPPDPTSNQPPPNIKITGIMKMDKGYQALFAIPPKEAKDATEYLCLSEGEKAGVLELVKIFPDKEECDVVNGGIRMTLSFKNNSYNPPKPVGQPGQPGQPPLAPPPPPQPVGMNQPAQPIQPAAPAAASSGVIVAGAQSSTGGNNGNVIVAGGYSGAPAGQNVQPAGNPPQDGSQLRQIPTRTLRLTPQGSIPMPAPQAQENIHPDVVTAAMAVTYGTGRRNTDGSYTIPRNVADSSYSPNTSKVITAGSGTQLSSGNTRQSSTVQLPPPLPPWEAALNGR